MNFTDLSNYLEFEITRDFTNKKDTKFSLIIRV